MNPVEEDHPSLNDDNQTGYDDGPRGRAAMDPTTRNLTLIASAIGVLLVVLIGGWMIGGRHSSQIPVIEAQSGPVRLKPIDPGGMQAMGEQAPPAMQGGHGQTLAPMAETARPEALQAEVDAARRKDMAGQAPDAAGTTPSEAASSAVEPLSAPRMGTPSSPAVTPLPLLKNPAEDRQDINDNSQLHTEADLPDQAPQAQPQAGVRSGHDGRLAVQLAALDSHKAAQTEWLRLRHSHPALFSGRVPDVEQADLGGRLVYRLRTHGFASVADADAFCAQARAQRVACTLADF